MLRDRVSVTLHLEREELDALDALAADRGLARSACIRDAIRRFLGASRRRGS
jgi:metal-responsive CopG/Arc/MetJ family transcriptional regulator